MAKTRGYDFRKTAISIAGLLTLLAILVLVNVLLSFASIRWDATEERIYSLSQGTRNILAGMGQPVTVKYFFNASSRDLPGNFKLYGKRVAEFLDEYRHASRGRIAIEAHDPRPDSDEEEWAQKYGLRPVQLGGERVYAGLVFLAAEREETIEFLDPAREELLEYDLTRIIQQLQSVEQKKVGILSTLPVFGQPAGPPGPGQPGGFRPWFFVEELRKTYEVREIDPAAEGPIDPALDLLLLVHPKGLSLKLQYAIDQYVLSGRNALVFVDPLALTEGQQQRFQPPEGSGLERLLTAWGVEMDPQKAVADLDQPTRIRTRTNAVEDSPVWVSAQGEAFNSKEVVTAKLERMLLPVTGALKKRDDSAFEFEPLLQSGRNSALVNSFVAGFGAATIRSDITPGGERLNLAVRVRGEFRSAFPAGPPREENAAAGPEPPAAAAHLEVGLRKSTVIIVADADMLADEFYVRRNNFMGFDLSSVFNDNLNFLANAVEILSGSQDLVDLRSRGKFERPFEKVLELKRQAQERWLAKEKELTRQVEATNRKLRELEQQKDSAQNLILSAEQEAEIASFREQRIRINRELKEVRKNLRADIEALGTTLKAVNIFMMPALVSLFGIFLGLYRQRRMRRK